MPFNDKTSHLIQKRMTRGKWQWKDMVQIKGVFYFEEWKTMIIHGTVMVYVDRDVKDVAINPWAHSIRVHPTFPLQSAITCYNPARWFGEGIITIRPCFRSRNCHNLSNILHVQNCIFRNSWTSRCKLEKQRTSLKLLISFSLDLEHRSSTLLPGLLARMVEEMLRISGFPCIGHRVP